MLFPVIVHKEADSDYGIIVPDFPGVFSGGQTLEEALENVQEALAMRFCDGEECIVPHPSLLADIIAHPDARDGAVLLVDFDPSGFLEATGVLSHVVVPLGLKRRIDDAAFRLGISSGEYLEQAISSFDKNEN